MNAAEHFSIEYKKLCTEPFPPEATVGSKAYSDEVTKRCARVKELQTELAEAQERERRENRIK